MKLMSKEEQKRELISMLKYIDAICRKNNLKYSLLGGSLIGAIRHKGMIPWDDDIDIILLKEDYEKLIAILKNDNNEEFELFDNSKKNYFYPFPKLISKKTYLVEENQKEIDGYGLFLDIFKYDNFPDELEEQEKSYKRRMIIKRAIGAYSLERIPKEVPNQILKKIKRLMVKIVGIKRLSNMYQKECEKFNGVETKFVIANWNAYGREKETQKRENFKEFIDAEFDGVNAMITKNYDEVLRTTFGDYMKLPPIEQRTAHNLKVYWREEE